MTDTIAVRDLFAAAALASLAGTFTGAGNESSRTGFDACAGWAYDMADAMMKERLRRQMVEPNTGGCGDPERVVSTGIIYAPEPEPERVA